MRKLFLLLCILFYAQSAFAENNYCYQKPKKCAAGDILILALSEDVAKYCDFAKQITALRRHTTSSSFNNQEVVCVKVATPRSKLK